MRPSVRPSAPAPVLLLLLLLATRCMSRAHLFTNDTKPTCVSVRGQCRVVELMWGDEDARAAAALLQVALRRELRYAGVRLRRAPRDLCRLAALLADDTASLDAGNYERVAVALSVSWRPHSPSCRALAATCSALHGFECGPGGARLRVLGEGATPPLRLHALLTRSARRDTECARAVVWVFYANSSALRNCAFIAGDNTGEVTLYFPAGGEWNDTRLELEARIASAGSHVRIETRNLTDIRAEVEAADPPRSFLFLDWALWEDAIENDTGVSRVAAPPCASPADSCEPDLDPGLLLRVADVSLLRWYAPPLFDVVRQFAPERRALREVLKDASDRREGGIERAASEWVAKNEQKFRSWIPETLYDYRAVIFFCARDPALEEYNRVRWILQNEISNMTRKYGFGLELRVTKVECTDSDDLRSAILNIAQYFWWPRLIGCVAGGEGAASAAKVAEDRNVPLVLYDSPPAAGRAMAATGGATQLALAMRRFCGDRGWSRIAVLSEPTQIAEELLEALQGDASLTLRDVRLPPNPDKIAARRALVELQNVNARIFLVNAEPNSVAAVLTAAAELDMTSVDRYAWIAREWYEGSVADVTHFTISFRYRNREDLPLEEGRVDLRDQLSRELGSGLWPPRMSSLIDATLTLVHGFELLYMRDPKVRFDVHAEGIFRSFYNRIIVEPSVMGIAQKLHYRGNSLETPLVFVDKWQDGERSLVATWRVTGDRLVTVKTGAPAYQSGAGPPSDGALRCSVTSGDAFWPSCHDVAVALGGVVLALTPVAAGAAWWRTRRLLARRDLLLTARVLARRECAAAALAAHLVDRKAIEMREELGSGRFGRVWLAMLREPGRSPRAIAVKTLRDDAAPSEESEFLREACVLASLDHENVVRFVGVCAVGGPPLVLMEHAFFGDLLRYLRARRHLAEGGGVHAGAAIPASSGLGEEEVAHVSALALTRLAREAASALGYLTLRGVVHRDVRASNCLVDARRSLKLADFGMARETGATGGDGAAEYACRRRGLFPVLWMAPESLSRGVFSAASDVWGLGVLVLELVTLGARPYGAWSPLRVLQFVAAGGRPALPLDATAQTRGLVLSCWRRTAEERPTAAEVVAYLAAHPRALRPALLPTSLEPRPDSADRPERADPTDSDSGFGETPFPDLE